jgi:preprotein translocase subunit SecG
MNITFPLASFVSGLLGFAMFSLSLFLILLILVQRGRGGGLTGALGGPGGQSAFGTKAGDLFTRITSFVALGWITLCAFTMWLLGPDMPTQAVAPGPAVSSTPADSSAATKDLIDLGLDKSKSDATSPAGESKPGVELTPANPAATETDSAPTLEAPKTDATAAPESSTKPADTTPAATEPKAE